MLEDRMQQKRLELDREILRHQLRAISDLVMVLEGLLRDECPDLALGRVAQYVTNIQQSATLLNNTSGGPPRSEAPEPAAPPVSGGRKNPVDCEPPDSPSEPDHAPNGKDSAD